MRRNTYRLLKFNSNSIRDILLYTLLLISILIISLIYFFENIRIPLLIDISVDNVNKLLEVLSLAYISSFVFYFIVVRLNELRISNIIYPLVADYTYVLMNNCIYFCFSLRHNAGLKYLSFNTGIHNRNFGIYPSDKELKTICERINPNVTINEESKLKKFRIIPHFYGIMIHYVLRMDYFLDILLEKSNFIDIKLLRILTDIKTSGYHYNMIAYGKDSVFTAKHRHDNLQVFFTSLRHYFKLFRELENYAGKNLKKYVERENLRK